MKSTSSALIAHEGQYDETTLATIVKVTRKDGFVLALTDHDVNIVFGGVTYLTALAANLSNVEMSETLDVDNAEATGFLDPEGISEASVAAGLWDFAEVRVSRVNWADLSMGDDKVKRGWLGQVSLGRNSFIAEATGLTQKLQQTIGETYSAPCKADLFDARCKIVPIEGTWKFSGITVDSVSDAQRHWISAALTQAADFFTGGTVAWTTGDNAGLEMEIKAHLAGGEIVLQEPMPFVIAPTDEYVIFAGCQKRWQEDCVIKFSNGKNHRGFPFLPGDDATLAGL